MRGFGRFAANYASLLRRIVSLRWVVLPIYLIAAVLIVWLVGRRLGTEIFPTVEAGQMALRVRLPTGTRVELICRSTNVGKPRRGGSVNS